MAQKVCDAFSRFDLDNNGEISRLELARVLQEIDSSRWHHSRISQLMSAHDRNHDGRLGIDEFMEWMWTEDTAVFSDDAKMECKKIYDATFRNAYAAAKAGEFQNMFRLISENPEAIVNQQFKGTGSTLLHLAAWEGDGAVLNGLLELRADPTAVNTKGQTARKVANNTQAVELLKIAEKASGGEVSDDEPSAKLLRPKRTPGRLHPRSPRSPAAARLKSPRSPAASRSKSPVSRPKKPPRSPQTVRPKIEPTASQVQRLKREFEQLDSNGDGKLSFLEMTSLLKSLSPKTFSEVDLQKMFCTIDKDQNGVVDFNEYIDFILMGKTSQGLGDAPSEKPRDVPKARPRPTAIGSPGGEGAETALPAGSAWKQACLDAHNFFRRAHGACDLTWSEECYSSAKKQADECQKRRKMVRGNREGPSGKHGQNIFWSSAEGKPAHDMVKAWYNELEDPGYDFTRPGLRDNRGAEHFTQVVWQSTRQVGMALSEDRRFAVANYFPAGNDSSFVIEVLMLH